MLKLGFTIAFVCAAPFILLALLWIIGPPRR